MQIQQHKAALAGRIRKIWEMRAFSE